MTDSRYSTDVERADFIKAHPHLDVAMVPDAWGRPMFAHSHVEAIWSGWKSRGTFDAAQQPVDSGVRDALQELYEFCCQIGDFRLDSKLGRKVAAALAAPQPASNAHTAPDGFVLVPKLALAWLHGEGPDADGKHFGECEDIEIKTPRKYSRRYWWRSKFRALCAVSSTDRGAV